MPRRIRPKFPAEWKVPNDPAKYIAWSHADQKLKKETVYWISTSSPDGKPHSAPVWGIWENQTFYFETNPGSPKARNLIRNPRIVFHVQDGMDTVIVKGTVEREKNSRKLETLIPKYFRKYKYKPDWADQKRQIVFRLKPSIAHAWKAPRMHRSLVNFIFETK